jgi:hypothetical protein
MSILRTRLFAFLAITGSIVALAGVTGAKAQTPIMHWGFDTRPVSVGECLRRAKEIIGVKGFQVTPVGNTVHGGGPNVAVLVECVGLGARTNILVVAASPNSTLAERTRNEVRIAVMR